MRGLLGKKIGMTRIFDEFGNVVPVTVLEASFQNCHGHYITKFVKNSSHPNFLT